MMRRPEALIATSLGVALFVVYALGASRTIFVGDSGELVAAVYTLGIPHPSGYPLYVLLGKLWTLLVPLGSVACRMSLFSAACASVACGGLYLLGRRLGLSTPAALFAALLLAFCPSFWSQANIQRVYSLNALFLVAATAVAVAWYRSRSPRHLALALFVTGLGACNHTFMGVFALVIWLFALATEPPLSKRPKELAIAAGAGLLGLAPYLYLPLRSRADPRLDWGNPETVGALLNAVLRRDFWNRAWWQGPSDLLPISLDYLGSFGEELSWVGAALALLGLLAAGRRRWPVLLLALGMAANLATVALHGSRTDIFIWHRYYLPSYLLGALLAGLGCQVVLDRLPRPRAALRFLPLVVPILLLALGWRTHDRSRYRFADDFSRTLLATLPPGAHLSATDDNVLFVLIHHQLVEGLRPDVDLILQGVGDADLPPLRFDPDTDPLFFTHHPNWSFSSLEIVPVGLAFRTIRAGMPMPPAVVPKEELEGESDPRIPRDYLTQNLIGHFHYMLGVTWEMRDEWDKARAELERAAAAAPHNDVLFYNLGLIYGRNGLHDRALASFQRSRLINPRHIAGNQPVRAADRVAEVRGEIERLAALEAYLEASFPGPLPAQGSAERHIWLAQELERHGEPLAARGHRRRAREIAAASP